jgi:hypothetical protein
MNKKIRLTIGDSSCELDEPAGRPMARRPTIGRRSGLSKRLLWLVTVVVALGLVVSGVAYAAIPSSGGAISGCYIKALGYVRLIDKAAGQQCHVTFANAALVPLEPSNTLVEVASKHLEAGSYAVVATANISSGSPFAGDKIDDVGCELHSGTGVIGGSRDRRLTPEDDFVEVSLAMNGGAQAPVVGTDVTMWCFSQDGSYRVEDAQMMITRVAGFF